MAPNSTATCGTAAAVIVLPEPPELPEPLDMSAMVRKAIPDEALVTGWSPVSDDAQRVIAEWPTEHAFYVQDGRYSPLLVVESVRQALALLTHSFHHVPLGHRLGLERLRAAVDPAALAVGSEPATVSLLITHPEVKRRRLGSLHCTSRIEVHRAGRPVGSAELAYTTYPPALYDRLRGRYADAARAFAQALPLTPPVAADLVGRHLERDVVLSPTAAEHHWQLRVDPGHRILFDHPHDHVPGMVLLEAAAQAGRVVAGTPVLPVAFDARFSRYVEFDRACLLTAEALPAGPADQEGTGRVRVDATQDGAAVFSVTVTTRPQYG
ncbi:ScbA/BarX family gamma-butyrolactone biosynthesis protein [Kitasatospora saccharophila]|uniref:ScbA/BarX family gamma-butyrolactone biosynthesis protein n=1 Tax=Kitasatospora saccharophila TaxID=407973 RepID=A0ABN2YEP1_9ACTN